MIAVTGSTGRLGQIVRDSATHEGIALLCQSRRVPPQDGFRWTHGEAVGEGTFAEVGAILHLAGATPTTGKNYSEEDFRWANVTFTRTVLEAAARHGVPRVLIASSVSVYGPPDTSARIFDEASPLRPLDAYSRSKAEMEENALSFAAKTAGLEVVILRISTVAGADQLFANARTASLAAPLVLDQFASGRGPLRSYIGPASLGKVLLALAHHNRLLPPVLNISLSSPVRMDDLLRTLQRYRPIHWCFRPAPKRAVERFVIDTTALERIHSFCKDERDCVGLVAQVMAMENTWSRIATLD